MTTSKIFISMFQCWKQPSLNFNTNYLQVAAKTLYKLDTYSNCRTVTLPGNVTSTAATRSWTRGEVCL